MPRSARKDDKRELKILAIAATYGWNVGRLAEQLYEERECRRFFVDAVERLQRNLSYNVATCRELKHSASDSPRLTAHRKPKRK